MFWDSVCSDGYTICLWPLQYLTHEYKFLSYTIFSFCCILLWLHSNRCKYYLNGASLLKSRRLNSASSPVKSLVSPAHKKNIITISPAWWPVNNMTHKPIRHLPAASNCPQFITPMTATPPVWPPANFPSAAHLFQSRSSLNDRTGAPKWFLKWRGGTLSWRVLGEGRARQIQ